MNESHALRRLLRFLWQFRLWLLISLLCAFISVLFSVIAPLLIGRIIDGITSGTALHAVMRELVLLAALYLSYSLFNWGMMYASNPTTFMSYTFDRLPYSLSKPVRAFLADSKGTLWIGTKGEGILRIPKFTNGGRITASGARHITTANSALSDESVYAFAESRSGVIWIGSEGKGIDYYSYKSGKIHCYS